MTLTLHADPPVRIYLLIRQLDAPTSTEFLHVVESKRGEYVRRMTAKGRQDQERVEDYLSQVVHALRVRVFTAEGTGFVFMAFDEASIRDKAAAGIEAIMPTNRYLVLKGRRLLGSDSLMRRFSTAWTPLKQALGLSLGGTYDLDFLRPTVSSHFLDAGLHLPIRVRGIRRHRP